MTNIKREVKTVEVAKAKVDPKANAKAQIAEWIIEMLEEKGVSVRADHANFGFTKNTVLAVLEETDVQIKLITPKAGTVRYAEVEEQ